VEYLLIHSVEMVAVTGGESDGAWVLALVVAVFVTYAVISITQRNRLADWLYRVTGNETYNRESEEHAAMRLVRFCILPGFAALFAVMFGVAYLLM
jgi:hypothetical protein